MSFWDEYEDRLERKAPPMPAVESVSRQNDTAGVCAFCGMASDDVLIGVCGDCAQE